MIVPESSWATYWTGCRRPPPRLCTALLVRDSHDWGRSRLQPIRKEQGHNQGVFAGVLLLSSASTKQPFWKQLCYPAGEKQLSSREKEKGCVTIKVTSLVSGRFPTFIWGGVWSLCLQSTFLEQPGVSVLCIYMACLPQIHRSTFFI